MMLLFLNPFDEEKTVQNRRIECSETENVLIKEPKYRRSLLRLRP
jgi:hypothetical protein